MSEPNYSEISPRMRRLVRLLRAWGYETTDSGDGTSELECAMPWPHVVAVVEPDELIDHARWLTERLRALGLEVVPMRLDGEGAAIQAGYCPAAEVATILLTGVTDEDLPVCGACGGARGRASEDGEGALWVECEACGGTGVGHPPCGICGGSGLTSTADGIRIACGMCPERGGP